MCITFMTIKNNHFDWFIKRKSRGIQKESNGNQKGSKGNQKGLKGKQKDINSLEAVGRATVQRQPLHAGQPFHPAVSRVGLSPPRHQLVWVLVQIAFLQQFTLQLPQSVG